MTELRDLGFMLSGESLAYVLAAAAWLRVWRDPSVKTVRFAAFATALCFLFKVARIALGVVVRP